MKALMLLLTAGLLTTGLFAAAPIVTSTDSMKVTATEKDDTAAARWRIALSGVGRFGADISMIDTPLNKSGELYGAGFDVMYNLLPEEGFNLWVGLGTTYMPKQDFASCAMREVAAAYTFSFDEKVKIKAYDLRFMIMPEWNVTESVALGLRLGVGVCHYSGDDTETLSVSDTYGSATMRNSYSYSETLFRAILGVQAHWAITEQLGALAYCQAYLGNEADLEINGEKVGEFDDVSAEIGIGLTYSF